MSMMQQSYCSCLAVDKPCNDERQLCSKKSQWLAYNDPGILSQVTTVAAKTLLHILLMPDLSVMCF